MPKRSYEEMSVSVLGSQSILDRFKKKIRLDHGVPPICQWRCNLTALSQVHNLYFVAYGRDIYVYVPQFPSQAVSEQPVLIFTSQPSSPGLTAQLDQRSPHAINNLITQLLGTEEAVAVVRDDGDVDAFLVRHVVQAIEQRSVEGSSWGVFADEIRPFFQSNVGISAWGLAIHSQSRVLATSSNAHEVRVFKFGLLHTDEDEDGNEERRTDVTHHVLNGQTNIPYIAFCNTGDDPEAHWLLTTDISGMCRVMDLRSLQPVQAFRFCRSFATSLTGGFDRLNAGWALMFLDRRSFKPEDSLEEAVGLEADETLPGIKRAPDVWDLSKTVKHLPEASEPFVYHQHRRRASKPARQPGEIQRDQSIATDNSETSSESESDGGAPLNVEAEGLNDESEIEQSDEPDSSMDVQSSEQTENIEDDYNDPASGDIGTQTSDDADDETMTTYSSDASSSPPLIDDGEDPDDEMTEDSISFTNIYNGEAIANVDLWFANASLPFCEDLPCPILHASPRNVYLLQPSDQKCRAGVYVPPLVGLASPLRQTIQQDFEYLRLFERLNMNAYIPAFGIVVLASQKGRAMVLALTKLPSGTILPGSNQRSKKTVYAMRLDAILPFASQEKENQRPFAPLHGIAVGPLQGSEALPPEQKRWRLMMMYQDHSILSYELGARRRGRHSEVDIERLVV